MVSSRRRNLLSSRRRVQDEGEEEDDLVEIGDDSQSEGSVASDGDAGVDADESDASEHGDEKAPEATHAGTQAEEVTSQSGKESSLDAMFIPAATSITEDTAAFEVTVDTKVMMNGLNPGDEAAEEEAILFEDSTDPAPAAAKPENVALVERPAPMKRESIAHRRTREHEEYKQKRDTDPAFVPTRGGFFMHDSRSDALGQGPFVPFGLGRGRGRGRARDFIPVGQPSFRSNPFSAEVNSGRWDHDLHETVTGSKLAFDQKRPTTQVAVVAPSTERTDFEQPPSLSKSVPVVMVMVRISLPVSKTAAKVQKMTVRQYTRLPDLRPPLRRDKPVRVSFPDRGPRYIFPSPERSFVFIPRAQRPNQLGTRAKAGSFLSHSQSRRTSAYGSIYDPSVSMSRRTSMAQDSIIMPEGMTASGAAQTNTARPVVKLPAGMQGAQQASSSVAITDPTSPSESFVPGQEYPPPPSQPAYREARKGSLTMHAPRPQKAVSVATIDPPNAGPFHAPQQQEQQPFYHQVPAHINGHVSVDLSNSAHAQLSAHDFGNQATPTSNIPETAINAHPFQPSLQHGGYGPPYPAQPVYEYYAYQPNGYMLPTFLPPSTDDGPAAGTYDGGAAGLYAQESNGMVYYIDPGVVAPDATGYYYGQTPVYYPS